MFDKNTYVARRKRLRKDTGKGLVLLPGNSDSPRTYKDNCYPFRQDSSFLYFAGLSLPDLVLVLDTESGEEILFGDDVSLEDIIWTGNLPSMRERAERAGIEHVAPLKDLRDYLNKALSQKRPVHYLTPYQSAQIYNLCGWLDRSYQEIKDGSSLLLTKNIINQRNYKSAEEVAELEKAVNVSVDMHVAAMKMIQPGVLESEVVAAISHVALAQGAGNSFLPIATINGQTLHTNSYTNKVQAGQLFLLDAGAETDMGYCGDLSSTFPVSGTFSPEQREVYEICLASHDASIAMMAPGVEFKDVYYQSARIILEGMKSMGIFKGNVEDGLVAGAHAMFFPCGLGHMLGLDVHDMEGLGEVLVGWDGKERSTQFGIKSLRLGRALEPGFVVTIEPGIYFIPQLIDMWREKKINNEFFNFDRLEKFKNFGGIRNEEDFLITETGYRLLGKPKPKTIADVENACR